MSLNHFFNDSLIDAKFNSFTASTLSVSKLYSTINISNGPVSTNNGTGTLNITPANLVSSVLGATGAGPTFTIQLPTAAAINTYLGTLPDATNTSFKFTICASSTTNVSFLMGSGITTFNGLACSIGSSVQKDLIFVQVGAGPNWVVYF